MTCQTGLTDSTSYIWDCQATVTSLWHPTPQGLSGGKACEHVQLLVSHALNDTGTHLLRYCERVSSWKNDLLTASLSNTGKYQTNTNGAQRLLSEQVTAGLNQQTKRLYLNFYFPVLTELFTISWPFSSPNTPPCEHGQSFPVTLAFQLAHRSNLGLTVLWGSGPCVFDILSVVWCDGQEQAWMFEFAGPDPVALMLYSELSLQSWWYPSSQPPTTSSFWDWPPWEQLRV